MTVQAAPVDAPQIVADTLTDIAVRIDTRQRTVDSLYILLQRHTRDPRGDRAIVALIAAAYADSEVTAGLLEDLATASTRLGRHRDTRGHDECCGGNCEDCDKARARWRCEQCETGPAEGLWEAQEALRHHLATLHSLDDLLRAASDGERQPREHPVPCQVCHRPTWEVSADCGQHTTAGAL